MTLKEFLIAFLSKTYKMDEAAVAELLESDETKLKADALDKLLNKDATRVTELTSTKTFDNGYKKGQKEALDKLEKELKEEHDITSTKVGKELIAEIIAAKIPTGDSLTEEQVKKHKTYLDLQESAAKQVKEAVKAKQAELDDFKKGLESKETLQVVKQKALAKFEALNPILSADAGKASKQKELFLKQFESGKYRVEGDRIILLSDDGTDKTDAHGQRIDFEAHVAELAGNYYDFKKAESRSSAGNENGNGGGSGNKVVVKDEKDFMAQMTAAKTPEERAPIKAAWDELQKAQAAAPR